MRRSLLRSGKLYDFGKCLWMIDCKVCQHFPIDADLFLVETIDQTRIGDIVQTCSGIDSSDPQSAELALLRSSVSVRVRAGLIDVMLRNGMDLAASTPVSFGRSKKFFSSPMGGNFIL
jgi:hypothetical protein